MKAILGKLFVFLIFAIFCIQAAYCLNIRYMTCEMQVNPLAVESKNPRFGWKIFSEMNDDKQVAYRILVSSTKENISKGVGDLWDSGKKHSSESQLVEYGGKPLLSSYRYYWAVEVWGKSGKATSDAHFDMAPSESEIGGNWIGAIKKSDGHLPEGRKWHVPSFEKENVRNAYEAIDTLAVRSIMLRKSFGISRKIASAKVYVSGLGQYELSLNGKKVGDSEFTPSWSDYDKTVYYSVYDVDTLLDKGENVIGIVLGNGFYNVIGNRYDKLWVCFGPPTLLFRMDIKYSDGTKESVVSDETWKYDISPLTFNNIYGGEDYDARLEQPGWNKTGFQANGWHSVVIQEAPKGTLRPDIVPAVKVMRSYEPKSVNKIDTGKYVLNMGQNLSGFPCIKVSGKRGSTIKLTVGELLSEDGTVSQKRSGGPCYYQYTLKGDGLESWSPRFSYYGFQYIQIEGADLYVKEPGSDRPVVHSVKSLFVHNSAAESGTFSCSNDIYNKAHILIQNAVKSNFQSIFTDCPHREKLGWLEQLHLNGPGLLFNYDLSTVFPKLVQDMADAQRSNGLVPSICPEYVVFGGDFTDSPEWGASSVIVPWMYYEYYGDDSLIRRFYPVMKRYVDYLTAKSDSGILSYGLGDWYDYGKHPAGYSKNSPISISATSHYYYCIDYLLRSAKITGNAKDVEFYGKLKNEVKDEYNRKFFNPETKQYANGSQFSNAVSLFMGLVDPADRNAVMNNLVADVKAHGNRLTTGDVGNRYLFRTLADNGRDDVMYEMTNHYDAPGYGYQLKFGVTTLTEQWDPERGSSWNHFMMGQIEEWFYRSLAGIQLDMKNPGFRHFFVKPAVVGDLSHVEATHECLYGTISVSWKKTGNKFELSVQVPVNTTATVVLPFTADRVVLNGKSARIKDGSLIIPSGKYLITAESLKQ